MLTCWVHAALLPYLDRAAQPCHLACHLQAALATSTYFLAGQVPDVRPVAPFALYPLPAFRKQQGPLQASLSGANVLQYTAAGRRHALGWTGASSRRGMEAHLHAAPSAALTRCNVTPRKTHPCA